VTIHPQNNSHAKRWALARAATRLRERVREAARALPGGAWRRWWATLLLGLLFCAALSWAMAASARALAPRGMDEWDARVMRRLEHGRMSFQEAILLESPGNLIYLIPVTVTAAVVAILTRRPVFAASIVASYVLMRLIVLVGWLTWDRPRPKLIAEGIAAPPLHSFPSGHVALALSVYGLLAYAWYERSRSAVERTLIVMLTVAFCLVVGAARVRLGTHWSSDVIGGAVLGVAWLPFAIAALRRAERIQNG
jgi:undecaprenyl-diphosphatase